MNDKPNSDKSHIVLYLLALTAFTKEYKKHNFEDKLELMWGYSQQAPDPPWNILIASPFPVVDAALALFIDGVPAFVQRRSEVTGVMQSITVERTQVTVGSSLILIHEDSLGETSILTMKTRTMQNDRTLFFAKIDPLTPVSKMRITTWLGSFFDWFLRDQQTWEETYTEEVAKEHSITLPNGEPFTTESPTYTLLDQRPPIDIALDWRENEHANGRKATYPDTAKRFGFSLSALQKEGTKRKEKKSMQQNATK